MVTWLTQEHLALLDDHLLLLGLAFQLHDFMRRTMVYGYLSDKSAEPLKKIPPEVRKKINNIKKILDNHRHSQ